MSFYQNKRCSNIKECQESNGTQVKKPCYECSQNEIKKCPPQLSTDCVVVESLICSKKITKVAELSVPIPILGDIIDVGPGGVISPLITLTPDINGVINQVTVAKDMVINTGYLPANITVLEFPLPIQISIPFQQETECPGLCPGDTVTETPLKIESVITQGVEALGVSVASIMFKVILSTNLTVTRPVIIKDDNLKLVKDVNGDRCEKSDSIG